MNRLGAAIVVATAILSTLSPTAVVAAYEVTDIGDLGFGYTQPLGGINDVGQIAGESQLPDGRARAILWSITTGLKVLQPLSPDERNSTGWALNNRGDVCGTSGSRAVIWWATGSTTDLGNLGRVSQNYCFGINDLGHAVGQTWAPGRAPMFMWTAESGMIDLGADGEAYAINNADEVTGQAILGPPGSAGRAFRWSADGLLDLGTLGGPWSVGKAINEAGVIAGTSATSAGGSHAFVWLGDGIMRDLGTLGGADSGALRVTSEGVVFGWSRTVQGDLHVFDWDPVQGMTDLQISLPAGWHIQSGTGGINSSGQMVLYGYQAISGQQHGFFADPTQDGEKGTLLRRKPK